MDTKFDIELVVEHGDKALYGGSDYKILHVNLLLYSNVQIIRMKPMTAMYIEGMNVEANEFKHQFGTTCNGEYIINVNKDKVEISLSHYDHGKLSIILPSSKLLISSYKDCLKKWKIAWETL